MKEARKIRKDLDDLEGLVRQEINKFIQEHGS